MQRDGSPTVLGFWVSLSASAVMGLGLLIRGERVDVWPVWIAGVVLGVAYAVGFCAFMMRCLKIGPAGPTVTINNMAMVCGVLYGILWLDPHTPSALVVAGVVGTCAALILIGMGKGAGDGPAITPLWLRLALAGGALSGLSFMAQTHVGLRYPSHQALFVVVGFGFAMLLLLPTMRGQWRVRRELWGGMAIGICTGLSMPLNMMVVRSIGPAVAWPVTVTTPVLIMLAVGQFAYKEHLSRTQWAGCLIGTLSVVLLACGSAPG